MNYPGSKLRGIGSEFVGWLECGASIPTIEEMMGIAHTQPILHPSKRNAARREESEPD